MGIVRVERDDPDAGLEDGNLAGGLDLLQPDGLANAVHSSSLPSTRVVPITSGVNSLFHLFCSLFNLDYQPNGVKFINLLQATFAPVGLRHTYWRTT